MKINLQEKRYYSIGEVASKFNVNPSLIRFWEQEFKLLNPKKNSRGNRKFTNTDIENINKIYFLLKEKGYTFCMIEHDMDFIGRLCDPVIVMAEGSVLFEGSVEDAKKDEKVIESYLGRGSKLKEN